MRLNVKIRDKGLPLLEHQGALRDVQVDQFSIFFLIWLCQVLRCAENTNNLRRTPKLDYLPTHSLATWISRIWTPFSPHRLIPCPLPTDRYYYCYYLLFALFLRITIENTHISAPSPHHRSSWIPAAGSDHCRPCSHNSGCSSCCTGRTLRISRSIPFVSTFGEMVSRPCCLYIIVPLGSVTLVVLDCNFNWLGDKLFRCHWIRVIYILDKLWCLTTRGHAKAKGNKYREYPHDNILFR